MCNDCQSSFKIDYKLICDFWVVFLMFHLANGNAEERNVGNDNVDDGNVLEAGHSTP